MKYHMIAFAAGFLLDLIVGDPYCLPHPIRMIGNLIAGLEKKLLKLDGAREDRQELRNGCVLVCAVLFVTGIVSVTILFGAYYVNRWLGIAVETIMTYQILATKCLKVESMKVYKSLKEEGLEAARKSVSMIVGRDTAVLDEIGVTKAAVETVAENASDGIIAPMFYMAIGGAPFMFLYKGINTMDSMLGYKNDRYLYFGRCAAKLDDAANYIPARVSGWLMVAGTLFVGLDTKNAAKIYRRDRRNHASPNSAQTEAAMAGALDVQLAGNAYYFGKLYEKPTIGDAIRKVEAEDIPRANRLLYSTSVLGMVVFFVLRLAV